MVLFVIKRIAEGFVVACYVGVGKQVDLGLYKIYLVLDLIFMRNLLEIMVWFATLGLYEKILLQDT